ncbi:MAG: RNA-binding cell elongation regulator Jag/EloR [Chloroflexota bacterium]
MSSEHSIETTGETVEEAIAKGLAELGVAPSDVIVEVLDEPSRGVFGIGAHPAHVRLKLFRTPASTPSTSTNTMAAVPSASQNLDDAYAESEDQDALTLMDEMREISDDADLDDDARVGKNILTELLDKMEIEKAEVIVRRAGAVDEHDSSPWLLDISGPDLSSLIGRRGETLAALQYVTRLIASRELQHRANIVIDAAGYKSRRSKMLHDLALRMADQAARSHRTVTLEPMPPYERRIVHLALRNRSDVQTKSVGEGNSRKVTIIPKSG